MSNNMFGSFLVLASIPLLLILIIIYFTNNQFKNIRIKLYKIILIAILVCAIIEICKVFLINFDAPSLLLEVVSRSQFAGEALWWYFYELYIISLFEEVKEDSFKGIITHNLFTKILTIYYIILVICIYAIPELSTVKDIDVNNIIYMPRFVLVISLFVIGICLIEAIYYLNKTKDRQDVGGQRAVMYTVSVGIIIYLIIQFLFPYISFPSIFFTIFFYLSYYLYENPDLAIIKEIESSKKIIEKANATKTDFLEKMAYDIKIPMNLISSLCIEVNNASTYNIEEARKDVSDIIVYGNELIDIINNVLDISKLETGKIIVNEINYKTEDLITSIINFANKKIGKKSVQFVAKIDPNIPSMMYGDYSKVYQSLLNIVSNAIKYTDVGKIILEIGIERNSEIAHLLFKVSDTGAGMSEEEQDSVFSENIDDEHTKGSGLGLAITKQFVEALGGKIWFESEYSVGTSFYMDINQKIVDPTPFKIGNEEEKNDISKLDCSNFRALIVDDNLSNINVVKRFLGNYNFQVDFITSGKECIDKIKAEEKYDIIFLDHVMPDIDGIEILKALRNLNGYVLPPIIALTANALVGMKEMYLSYGFDDYLAKPINTHELDRIINKFFKK